MKHFLLTWLGTAVALLITAKILEPITQIVQPFTNDGFIISNFGAAMIAAVAIGLVNAIIRPILRILAFPITLLTFGLFTFVINGVALWFASTLIPGSGFEVKGPIAAILGSIVLAIVSSMINYILRVRR
jgi:putative membrane protein